MKLNPIVRALWPYRFMFADGVRVTAKVLAFLSIAYLILTLFGELIKRGESQYICRDGEVYRTQGDYWVAQGEKCFEVKDVDQK